MITAGRVIQMEDATGFPVAVKRWNKKDSDKAEWEQNMLRLIEGEGVPRLVRTFEDAEYVYVVTEWISGVTLDKFVEESGGFLNSKQALEIGDRILGVLQRLHHNPQGAFAYTDLKPSNVMVKDGKVFLVDFESVCPVGYGAVDYDRKTVIMGTRPFTAPEVFTGKIQPECDYYSLGVLMFYMLTGELWQGDFEVLEEDPLGYRILELLAPDPAERKKGLKMFPSESFKDAVKQKVQYVAESHLDLDEPKVIFVHDNPRFAIEMAYEAATHMNLKVGIFTVMESDNPPLVEGLNMNVKNWPVCVMENKEAELDFLKSSDVDQWLEEGYLIQGAGCNRLFVSLIQPRETMRHMEMSELREFSCWARRNFDMTILLGNMVRNYIAYTCDKVVVAPRPDFWEMKDISWDVFELMDFGYTGSVCSVAWEYKEGVSLAVEKFAEKMGKNGYMGEIYYDSNRQITENLRQLPYCFSMPEIIKQQYEIIIKKLFYK